MEWGSSDKIELFKKREARGETSPSWDNRPHLKMDSVLPWYLFTEINKCRQSGMAANPLSASDVILFLDIFDFDREQRTELFFLIKALDIHWITTNRKISNADSGTGD